MVSRGPSLHPPDNESGMFGFARTLRFPSHPSPSPPTPRSHNKPRPRVQQPSRLAYPGRRMGNWCALSAPRMMSALVESGSPEHGRGGVRLSQDNCKTWSECMLVNTVKLSHAAGKFAASSSRFILRLFVRFQIMHFQKKIYKLSGIALASLIFLDIIINLSTLNFKYPAVDIPANEVPLSKRYEFPFRQVMRKSQHVSDKKERTVNAFHERTTAFHTCIPSRESGTSGHGFSLSLQSGYDTGELQSTKTLFHRNKVLNGPAHCLGKLFAPL